MDMTEINEQPECEWFFPFSRAISIDCTCNHGFIVTRGEPNTTAATQRPPNALQSTSSKINFYDADNVEFSLSATYPYADAVL